MKKKQSFPVSRILMIWKSKLFLTMRLTFFIMLLSMFQCFASNIYSQNTRLTMKMENTSIKQVLNSIEEQTDFFFLYNSKLIDVEQKVSVNVSGQDIRHVLGQIFEHTNIGYEIVDRQILLSNQSTVTRQPSQTSVKGLVFDSRQTPLPGVSIVVKGTSQGTITSTDGVYVLTNIPSDGILVFSFIGMKTQEIQVKGRNQIDVVMEEETVGIEEVVAIGYGTLKSSHVTGSIAKLKSESLEELAAGRLDQALMGKLAGVQVQQLSGAPGRALSIKVRGTSSINYSNAPLYVVDGYPVDGDLSTVNMNDIESIEVLKDAASAAIYGSRGSNGVILITTKSGKKGKTELAASVYYGIQKRFSKMDVLTRDEWIEWAIEERNNSWILQGGHASDPNSARKNSSYWIDPVWLTDPGSLPDNDWQDIVDRVAPIQNYQLSASGANDMVQYYISGNYFNQKGIILNSYYRRLSFQSNVETKFSDIVRMGLNLTGAITEQNDPDTDWTGGGISRSWQMAPVVGIDQNTEDGGYYQYAGTFMVNPYHWMKETLSQTKGDYLLSNIYFDLQLAKNLNWKSSLGMERRNNYYQYFIKNYVNRGKGSTGIANSGVKQNYLTEHTLKYRLEKTFWTLDAMGGFSYQGNSSNRMELEKRGYPDDSIYTLNVATTLYSGSSNVSKWRLMSFIGRMNLSVKDKYLLTANIRRDGSSRFGSDSRWGWFPSVSLGWRITEEKFLKDTKWLNNLKLRGSYGVVGNNDIGDYSAIGTLGVTNAIIGSPENIVSGLAPASFSNTDLGWERTLTTDIGMDVGLFNNRVQLTADYYVANTKDLLLDLQIPQATGFSSSLQNVGETRNTGLEIELNTANVNRKFKWNTSFNMSFNRNKVVKLGPDGSPIYGYLNGFNVTITQVGKPIGSYYLLEQEGVFMDQADFDSHPHYNVQNVGDIKYRDYTNDGKINAEDIHIVGDAFPDFYWGMRNTFSYKGFDLSVVMDGQHGADGINMGMRSTGQSRTNDYSWWKNRWRSPENPGDGKTPRAAVTANLTTPSTFWLFDATQHTGVFVISFSDITFQKR